MGRDDGLGVGKVLRETRILDARPLGRRVRNDARPIARCHMSGVLCMAVCSTPVGRMRHHDSPLAVKSPSRAILSPRER